MNKRIIHTKDSLIDWIGSIPFFIICSVGIFGPFSTGISWISIALVIVLYYSRMFFVTGFLHRYFSHRSYRTNRVWQFIFALCACTAVQNGPLWWAYHHRHHHKHSDTGDDFHSNYWWGFLESHFLWFLRINSQDTDFSKISDLSKYPELRALDIKILYAIPPTILAIGCYILGTVLKKYGYSTNGPQLFVGFFTSTFLLHNGTFTINSLSHMYGSRRYETGDKSLNNWFLAIFVTLGEGWHNNHHHQPSRIRQGHRWYEFDMTYRLLEILKYFRIISDLRYT